MKRHRDHVLAGFLETWDGTARCLEDYLEREPQYTEDILQLAGWSVALDGLQPTEEEKAPVSRRGTNPEDERFADRLFAMMRAAKESERTQPSLFRDGILALVRAMGLEPVGFAKSLGLGGSILAKLDRRLLKPDSIPAVLVTRLAGRLRQNVEDVRSYFYLPPTLSPSASYRAHGVPAVQEWLAANGEASTGYRAGTGGPELAWADASAEAVRERRGVAGTQQAFTDAVRLAPDMTESEKAAWLEGGIE